MADFLRMTPRRIRRIRIYVVVFLLSFVGFLWICVKVNLYDNIDLYIKCSDDRSKQLLETTCDLYRKGQIVGDLCPLMCDKEKVKYKSCLNHRGGKSVLVVACEGVCVPGQSTSVMLKTQIQDKLNHFENMFTESWNTDLPSTIDGFKSLLKQMIWTKHGINISQSEDVIQKIFQPDYDQYINPLTDQKYKAFVLTVWSLVQQDEYLLTKLHQNSPLFPQIYHSCGSLYLMESAPPGKILQRPWMTWNPSFFSWKERANLALKLLDTVLYMDSKLHQSLHMCDLKGENFGIAADGAIKLIDTDDIFFEKTLYQKMADKKTCSVNHDCNIICECHGVCLNGVCQKSRINNNLQSLCENILMPTYLDASLLRYPPDSIESQLQDIFKLCVPPFKNKLDEKMTINIHWKLYNLLKSTLKH